jgi:hypothetical protein
VGDERRDQVAVDRVPPNRRSSRWASAAMSAVASRNIIENAV